MPFSRRRHRRFGNGVVRSVFPFAQYDGRGDDPFGDRRFRRYPVWNNDEKNKAFRLVYRARPVLVRVFAVCEYLSRRAQLKEGDVGDRDAEFIDQNGRFGLDLHPYLPGAEKYLVGK